MITPTRKDISIVKGDAVDLELEFENEDGTPVDLTGKTLIMNVRDGVVGGVVLTKSVTSHTDPTNGKTKINFVGSDTNGLTAQHTYVYSISLDSATFLEGFFVVTWEV